jgi:predicted transcriptional regulator
LASPRKEVQFNLRVPHDLAEKVDEEARNTRTNRSWVIREALHFYFVTKSTDEPRQPE